MKTLPSDYTKDEWDMNHYGATIGQIVKVRRVDGTGGHRDKVVDTYKEWWNGTTTFTITTMKGHVINAKGGSEYFIAG